MHPCFLLAPESTAMGKIPTPGIIVQKILTITELLSSRCYTGLGFSVLAGELPGRAS